MCFDFPRIAGTLAVKGGNFKIILIRSLGSWRQIAVLAKLSAKKFFSQFLGNFDQKIAFFSARAPPSKLVYIGAKGASRKNF